MVQKNEITMTEKSKTVTFTLKLEHCIDAHYVNTPVGVRRALTCDCGFSATEESWECAGEAMDNHIEEVKRRIGD